jgi:ATP-dependent Clp protease protease subunit
LNKILSDHTGQTVNKIEKDSERNFFMSPVESKKYGIIDEILVQTSKPSKQEK